jgi:inner membrane protein
MYKTHVVFGILLLLLLNFVFDVRLNVILFILVIFGTLLPDIDVSESIMGRKIWPLSLFLEHRGFFHSLFAVGGFAFLFYIFNLFVFNVNIIYSIVFCVGYISHLFLDALTYKGIRPFYPIPFSIKGFLSTNSFMEKILFVLFILLIPVIVFLKFF